MSFKEVIGQDSAISLLKAAYRQNRISHAYVFVGLDGTGKKKTALNFAKLLVCELPEKEEPCDRCSSCLKVNALNHPDIQWVSPEGQFIKIDTIREACRRLNLVGFESNRKVLIILGAQSLNEESSNALLKTLEEPTAHTVILLITDTLKSILPTIASRCQRIIFSPLKEELIQSVLSHQWGTPPEETVYLARISGGSLGKALLYHKEGLFTRKNRMISDILDKDYPLENFVEMSLRDRSERSAQIHEVLCVLSSWFRDLLLAKILKEPKNLINIDRKDDIMRCSGTFSFAEIEQRIQAIAETMKDVERNINMRISLTHLRVELWK